MSAYGSVCGRCYCEYTESVKEAVCVGMDMSEVPSQLPTWVERITIDHNSINYVDLNQLSRIYPNLQYLSLKDNPICLKQTIKAKVSLF